MTYEPTKKTSGSVQSVFFKNVINDFNQIANEFQSVLTQIEELGNNSSSSASSFILKEEFASNFQNTIAPHTGTSSILAPNGWTFLHYSAESLPAVITYMKDSGSNTEFGTVRMITGERSGAGVNTAVLYKDAVYFSGQDFTLKIKARVEYGNILIGLFSNSSNADGFNTVFPEYEADNSPLIALKGTNSGVANTTWNWERANGTTTANTTNESVVKETFVEVQIKCVSGVLKASVIGGSGDYADITTVIPNNVWLIPAAIIMDNTMAYTDRYELTI